MLARLFFLFIFLSHLFTMEYPGQENDVLANTSIIKNDKLLAEQQSTSVNSTKDHRYFKVISEKLPIYDNSSGSLVQVGTLEKGQVYPRVSDYGNWHRIKYGNGYGYVWKEGTTPDNGSGLKNINDGRYQNSSITLRAVTTLNVYDNSSGSLVQFATVEKGTTYPLIGEYGNWYRIELADRIGYVHASGVALPFTKNDRYFKTLQSGIPIYDNSSGSLVRVGILEKGQVYPRVSDYGNWHRIKMGTGYGFVWKEATTPDTGNSLKNENKGRYKDSSTSLTAISHLNVYDNTSGSLVRFATIEKGTTYPLISEYGSWYRIQLADRIGYVHASGVKIPFTSHLKYFEVLQENLTVYDNRSGELVPVGSLKQGEVYSRISDYGNWHRIQFGEGYGYVWKEGTHPVIKPSLPNENNGRYKSGKQAVIAQQNVDVHSQPSNNSKVLATILKDNLYPIISAEGDWFRLEISGLIGYLHKSNVSVQEMKGLNGKTIIIDPGHGGHDPGALGNGLQEKEIVLDVSLRIRDLLVGEGAKVIVTRERDIFLELPERVDIARKNNADLFVSIHVNSFFSSSANGAETYYSPNTTFSNDSKRLAENIQKHLVKTAGMHDRGVKTANFHVIRYNVVPSALVELGFITNHSDAQKLKSHSHRDKFARAVYQGIMEYFNGR